LRLRAPSADRLYVLTVVCEIKAILEAKSAPLGYDAIASYLETGLKVIVTLGGPRSFCPKRCR